jgi:cell surface protein SprA
MGLVTRSPTDSKNDLDARFNSDYSRGFEPDSPEVDPPDLPYPFKDNQGHVPLLEPKSKFFLETPENIKTETKYDPSTGNYEVEQKIGETDYRPDTYMSKKEFQDYMFRKQMRDYFRSRVTADELNEKPRKGMIPPLKVNSELFDRIFGGNTVDIKPTGTAELLFGLVHTKNQNPAIPQRQQSITNFDFNMRIQLNLVGKIGDKLKVTTNYNTEASFDWENQIKVDYTGYEDEIIKKIEAGNVSLPLNTTLISGSQTLFGFKTELQFGKLRATTVFSQQRGKKQEVTVQGGAQTQSFTVNGDNYEQNKHFFLGHYFFKNYDTWMSTLPVINTPVVITKIEVYLLGINGNAEQTRNVAAFEDLGEDVMDILPSVQDPIAIQPSSLAIVDLDADVIPKNEANSLYSIMTNTLNGLLKDREIDRVTSLLSSSSATASNANNSGGVYMDGSRDFNIIRNARKLNATEYYFNPRTGFISLNQQLNNEQSLAVSYQYTYGGETFQVGEFSEQVPDNSRLIVCKLLKTNAVSVRHPMWKLMMKNVYTLGAYNLNPEQFKLNVFYNNIETGVDVPYLPYGKPNGVQLIRVLGCDRLSVNGDKFPDGIFDFLDGYTIVRMSGRVYFPKVEPFGRGLESEFAPEDVEKDKYIFKELYDSTKTAASFIQSKNRFKIKGTYRSSSGSEIALNALNVPQGAVLVTANGVPLQENADYTVDYTLGRVKIINEGLLTSGATIKVSLESNSLFQVQQKSLWGTRLDYDAGRHLKLGGTFLRFNERPLTQKVSFGDEPVSNIVAGADFNYKNDVPFLTTLLDKLPFYSTKEMSSVSMRGEIAKLFPGNAKAISKSGNSYIDDFEGSVALIDIRNPTSWFLSSIPQGQKFLFPEAFLSDSIDIGKNRARLNWYTIDAMFTRDQGGVTPEYYNSKKLFSNNMWRQVFETELFPGKTPPNGQQVVLPLLDLGFYPSERGPYNYDVKPGVYSKGINPDGSLVSPETRWGGIMRRLETNDFQAANVEYIQFWLMDPYNEDYNQETDPSFDKNQLPSGDLYFNIGNVSEDIIKDGRMSYENGIPAPSTGSLAVFETRLATVPALPPVINAFSQNNDDRAAQDVGYDGMIDEKERSRFAKAVEDMRTFPNIDPTALSTFTNDPSTDNYNFFRDDQYDAEQATTLTRYSKYNNVEGNSPTEAQYGDDNPNGGNYPTGATTLPNIEDINKDNTLSESENYYQYRIKISPQDVNVNSVGTNFIVDAFKGTAEFSGVSKTVTWYQFKIPINQFERVVGGIEGFNSIRFMRVFMKGFNRPVLLRMARLELVRSDWRRYTGDLRKPGEYPASDDNSTTFDISAVSLQENGTKSPVNYILPPEIEQQQNVLTTNLVLQNEQALQMRVCNLKDGDSRAIFKNVDYDTRMFNNIKMNVHAERLNDIPLNDGDLTLFFRIGTDYNNNFYEYAVPLKLTPKGVYNSNSTDDRYAVWPASNEVNFNFSRDITTVKARRNSEYGYYSDLNQLSSPYTIVMSGYSVTIVGNPNLGTVKSVMVGIRNEKGADNLAHCVEVWINELRLTDFNNEGGWATTGQLQAKLADLATVSLAGTYKSPFWGSVEQKINERSKEQNISWDVSTSVNAGKFFPNKWKVTLPVNYNFGRTKIIPLFNPLDPDVRMSDLDDIPISDSLRDAIKSQTIDFRERKGFSLSGVRIDGLKRAKAKPMPWDVSNFTGTYAYTESSHNDVNVEYDIVRQHRGSLQYAFALRTPPVFKPFSKSKALKNKWFALIKDFNFQPLPSNFGFALDFTRNYASLKNRDITSFYDQTSDAFLNPSLINKNFLINRSYNFNWPISKTLKFDYTANNEGRILEPQGEVYSGINTNRDSIVDWFFNGNSKGQGKFGDNTIFRQQMNLNWDVPLSKIPVLDFVKVTYRYGGTYTWTRKPFAVDDSDTTIANTIQNTASHNLTGSFAMMQLYNKIPYFKKVNSPKKKPGTSQVKATGAKSSDSKDAQKEEESKEEKPSTFEEIAEALAKLVMMVKNVSLTFQQETGQALPNFIPNSQIMGMDLSNGSAPGFLFTTGLYDENIRQTSAQNGWITKNPNQNSSYTEMRKQSYNYRLNVEPHSSFRIELNGNYTNNKSYTSYILYDPTRPADDQFDFNASPVLTGNFNITTISIFKAFQDGDDPIKSDLFEQFLINRPNTAKLLSESNPNSAGLTGLAGQQYYDGYSNNQKDVLLNTFYETYTGRTIENFSTQNIFPKMALPNWTASWDGLGKLPIFKKTFRSITLRHGYRSIYNINAYTNNILFNTRDGIQDVREPIAVTSGTTTLSQNFVSYYNINSVTLSESFSPLIKFDFQFVKPGWSANVENKRDKTTTLNLTGFQIIETKGQEFIIGLGYMYPKLKFKNIRIQGKALESNLTVKVDLSFRRNVSIIRQVTDGTSTPTAGTDIFTLRSYVDYQLTQAINLRIYYDWIRTVPRTSASFPTSNTNAGFSVRINFQ